MVTTLKGTNIELIATLRTFIDERVESIAKLLGQKQKEAAKMDIEVGRPSKHHRKGAVFYAEINLEVGPKLFRASAQDEDLHTAIDAVRDELKRQLRKYKTKKQSQHRRVRTA